MPPKKVKLHVSTNNNANGSLKVKVAPWRVRLDPGDVVQWELDATGPAANDILWFRVEQTDQVNPWPFNAPLPPASRYTGLKSGTGTATSAPRNSANPVGTVITYGLTIGFQDGNGKLRTMFIDPDMIIDT